MMTTDPQPSRRIKARSFTEVLAGLPLALADESELSFRGSRSVALELAAAGLVQSVAEAQLAIWHRLTEDKNQLPEAAFGCGVLYWCRSPRYEEARACIRRVYEVTDRLPRTEHRGIEQIRPPAFKVCMGCLRARWAVGNFRKPSVSSVRGWLLRFSKSMAVMK